MIIIAGWLQVDCVNRDRYVADYVAIVQQARTAPGCLEFDITADSVEPDRINVDERWESDAQSEQFRGSGSLDAVRAGGAGAWASAAVRAQGP
jgi:quinol monooxygenase YgiN